MSYRERASKGKRVERVSFRSTTDFMKKLSVYWKTLEFQDTNGEIRKFKSISEFFEHVMYILMFSGNDGWKLFSQQKLKLYLI
jgi:hypothetical protein